MIQLPADFKPWRLAALGCAAGLIAFGTRLFLEAARSGGGMGAVGIVLLGMACFVSAAILMAPSVATVVARPLTNFMEALFHPTETLHQPPEALLRELRMRLRDRFWESVAQQLDALTRAYGPSPELLHLRAHLVAGQTGDYQSVTALAVTVLSSRGFDRYTALLRRDPPPREIQTGIDA